MNSAPCRPLIRVAHGAGSLSQVKVDSTPSPVDGVTTRPKAFLAESLAAEDRELPSAFANKT